MRWCWSALLPACLAMTACSSEPDFDRRYAERQQELDQRAAAMDSKIDARLTETPPSKQGDGK